MRKALNNWSPAMGIILFLNSFLFAGGPDKKALIIAISNYPAETGWSAINAANDVDVIKSALIKQGFQEEGISVLLDEHATRDGIFEAMAKWEASLNPGDVAVFHFSGHGQQVADDNGDEVDGFDEAIVPINSPMTYQEGIYEGKNLIRDEELGDFFNRVRSKITSSGNLMVILDACHSGTGTRGFGVARGTSTVMASKDYIQAKINQKSNQKLFLESRGAADEASLAPMVAFFGSADNQLNYETRDENGRPVGSLSYAFGKTFSQANPNTTYRGLFDKIKIEMTTIAPRQQPQVEGTLDQEILGGKILGKLNYFKTTKYLFESELVINAGWLQGIYEDTKVGFFPPETRDFTQATPIAEGYVTKADATESRVTLATPIQDKETALNSWVFVMEKNFGKIKVSLGANIKDTAVKDQIRLFFEDIPVIEWSDDFPDLLLENTGPKWKLATKENLTLLEKPGTMPFRIIQNEVKRNVFAFAQAKFLKGMDNQSFGMMVDFEIIPIEYDTVKHIQIKEMDLAERLDAGNVLHLKVGDVFKLRVTNHGTKPAYFTLLDFQPDNEINILIPNERETPEEFRVFPDQTVEIPRAFKIGPPLGSELFKLFATEQPVDLRPILLSRGTASRGVAKSPFEQLIGDSFVNDAVQSRGGKTIGINAGGIHVSSYPFVIEE